MIPDNKEKDQFDMNTCNMRYKLSSLKTDRFGDFHSFSYSEVLYYSSIKRIVYASTNRILVLQEPDLQMLWTGDLPDDNERYQFHRWGSDKVVITSEREVLYVWNIETADRIAFLIPKRWTIYRVVSLSDEKIAFLLRHKEHPDQFDIGYLDLQFHLLNLRLRYDRDKCEIYLFSMLDERVLVYWKGVIQIISIDQKRIVCYKKVCCNCEDISIDKNFITMTGNWHYVQGYYHIRVYHVKTLKLLRVFKIRRRYSECSLISYSNVPYVYRLCENPDEYDEMTLLFIDPRRGKIQRSKFDIIPHGDKYKIENMLAANKNEVLMLYDYKPFSLEMIKYEITLYLVRYRNLPVLLTSEGKDKDNNRFMFAIKNSGYFSFIDT